MPILPSSLPDPVLEGHVFWDRYKKEIIAALLIALLAVAAYGGYRFYSEHRENAAASALAASKTPADLQKVITQYSGTPAGASAFLFLAERQRKEKKYAEANATLKTFLDKNSKHELASTARMATAANLEALGKPDEALATYQRLAASDPRGFNAPLAMLSEVPLLKAKNQIDEARRICETILTQYRTSGAANEATRQLRLLKDPSKAETPVTPTGQSNAAQPAVSAKPMAIPSAIPATKKP
ncbi:MAG: tetratricopeptide repeat protein [Verrucomicrobiota bacterium]